MTCVCITRDDRTRIDALRGCMVLCAIPRDAERNSAVRGIGRPIWMLTLRFVKLEDGALRWSIEHTQMLFAATITCAHSAHARLPPPTLPPFPISFPPDLITFLHSR